MMRASALLLVALASACPSSGPRPTPPPPAPDGPPVPDPVLDGGVGCSLCASPCDCACCVLGSYNADGVVRCREALPTAKGESCTEVCLETAIFPGGHEMPTDCVRNAAGLTDLRSVCHVCRP